VTAVTTAGLLAGLFGSAFVPAANAAGTDVDAVAIRNSFTEVEDGYDVDVAVVLAPTGSATRPYVLYAPDANTGGAAATAVTDFVCFQIAEADLVDKNGDALSDQDDVSASVSVSGSIILFAEDSATAAAVVDSDDEGDYGTAAFTSESISDGIAFCATVSDDDLAGSGIVTVKVNNVVVKTVNITVAGPTTSVATASRVGEWVAMDNDAVAGAMSVTFRDATGRSLYATGIDLDDIEEHAIRGAEGTSVIRYYVDDVAVGDNDSALASENVATGQRRVDLATELCDSATDDVGAAHTVYVVIDRDGDDTDTRESGDLVSSGTTFKCSDSAANWSLKGLSFYDGVATATEVALGDYVYLTIDVEDGSGNPLGVGIDADLTLLIAENTLEQGGDLVGASFFPIELDTGNYDATGAQLFEVDGDGLCVADGDNVDSATDGDAALNFLEAGKVFLCYQASYNVTGKHVVRMTLDQYEGATAIELAQQTVSASITVVDPSASGTTGNSAATIARNAAKTTATITIPAAAGKLVTITIENVKTGATKTYYRKAAAVTGVAKFTLRKAGKWEVFASYSNLVTDTVKLKK
jgi:hypothetical protein